MCIFFEITCQRDIFHGRCCRVDVVFVLVQRRCRVDYEAEQASRHGEFAKCKQGRWTYTGFRGTMAGAPQPLPFGVVRVLVPCEADARRRRGSRRAQRFTAHGPSLGKPTTTPTGSRTESFAESAEVTCGQWRSQRCTGNGRSLQNDRPTRPMANVLCLQHRKAAKRWQQKRFSR